MPLDNFLANTDLYGSQIGFMINKRQKYHTLSGFFASIYTYVFFLLLFYLFGRDFYLQRNPKYSSSIINTSNEDKFQLTQDNFFISFRFEDSLMLPYNKIYTDIFTVNAYFHQLNTILNQYNKTKISTQNCTHRHVNIVKGNEDKIKPLKYINDSTLCLDENFNVTIFDTKGSRYMAYMTVEVEIREELLSPENKDLLNQKLRELKSHIKKDRNNILFFKFTTQKIYYYYNLTENPIFNKTVHERDIIDLQLNKERSIYYKSLFTKSDFGMFFSNKIYSSYIDFEYMSLDFNNNLDMEYDYEQRTIHKLSLFVTDVQAQHNREYQKFHQCFANIYAMWKIIVFFFAYIIDAFNRHDFYVYITRTYYKQAKNKFYAFLGHENDNETELNSNENNTHQTKIENINIQDNQLRFPTKNPFDGLINTLFGKKNNQRYREEETNHNAIKKIISRGLTKEPNLFNKTRLYKFALNFKDSKKDKTNVEPLIIDKKEKTPNTELSTEKDIELNIIDEKNQNITSSNNVNESENVQPSESKIPTEKNRKNAEKMIKKFSYQNKEIHRNYIFNFILQYLDDNEDFIDYFNNNEDFNYNYFSYLKDNFFSLILRNNYSYTKKKFYLYFKKTIDEKLNLFMLLELLFSIKYE